MSGTKISGESATVALSPDASGELPAMGALLGGRYELLGLLGVGGMGSVYRARDVELDEIVAIKMIARELVASPGMLDRFKQEVKLARRVTHKNVARMFDIGEHQNLKFLTMEFIEGESLGDVLEREPVLSAARIAPICQQICAGLGAAHDAGVVHRDLKPDNVMIAKDGRVVIMDFGIARAMAGGANRTQGMPVGTPAYMAPEQVEGASDIDARADIYAFGVMMYEMVVGKQPFDGDSVFAIAAARLMRPPPNPQEHGRDIPDAIAQMITKCMARKKEDRYSSVSEISSVFDSITLPAMPSARRAAAMAATTLAPSLPGATDTNDHRKIVAVLPLRNAGSPEDNHIAEGLTEDIIDALSVVKGVRVRAKRAQTTLAGVTESAEVGRSLGVHVMVEGSLRRVNDLVRVTLRLVNVADGLQIWAKRFERPLGDVLRIGDEAAAAVAGAITAEIPGAAVGEQSTNDPVAVELYLRGRAEYHRTWHDSNSRAIDLFTQALERAPTDTKIMGAYALALARRYAYEFGAEHTGPVAVQAAERALALAPSSTYARTALAVVRWNEADVTNAAREVSRAVRNGPANADAQDYMGRLLLECNRVEDAIARFRMALAIESRLLQARCELARGLFMMGRESEAFATLGEPPADRAMLNGYWTTRIRLSCWRKEKVDVGALREKIVANGLFETQSLVLAMLDTITNPHTADALTAILMQFGSSNVVQRRQSFFAQLACEVWCIVGNPERAMDALEKSYAAKLSDLGWLDHCPLLDPLRGMPKFESMRDDVAARAEEALRALEEKSA